MEMLIWSKDIRQNLTGELKPSQLGHFRHHCSIIVTMLTDTKTQETKSIAHHNLPPNRFYSQFIILLFAITFFSIYFVLFSAR